MTRNLFTAAIDDIEFADVVAFCEQGMTESNVLEYKRELPAPEKLVRTASAFANTLGGLIIIGVDEDDTSRPRAPFIGMPYQPKLEETVWNSLLAHVDPPIMPEVHVCQPQDGRTYLLIRVAASEIAPHTVRHGTKVYLRVGNVTQTEELEKLATLGQIEWLQNRRRKSETLRADLISRAAGRVGSVRHLQRAVGDLPRIEVYVVPRFPTGPLLTTTELSEMRQALRLHADRNAERTLAQDSVLHVYHSDGALETFSETNIFGLVFLAMRVTVLRDDCRGMAFLDSILSALADTARFAKAFTTRVGYWATCELGATLLHVRGLELRTFGHRSGLYKHVQVDDRVHVSREIPHYARTTDDDLLQVLTSVGRDLGWSFGWMLGTSDVATYLRDSEGWRL